MNSRIKELVERATVTYEHATGAPYSVFDEELFARLIVQKWLWCARNTSITLATVKAGCVVQKT